MYVTKIIFRSPNYIRTKLRLAFPKFYSKFTGENEFFHLFMENNINYKSFVKPKPITCKVKHAISEAEAKELINGDVTTWNDFIKLSHLITNLDIKNPKYINIVNLFLLNLDQIDNNTLKNVLFALNLWPVSDIKIKNLLLLTESLNKEFCTRITTLTVVEQLEIADLFYHLTLGRPTKYNYSVIISLLSNENRKSLPNSQFIYALFLINLQREFTNKVSFTQIEIELTRRLESLSLNEIGISVISFFKTKTKMQNENLLSKIMDITIKNISKVEDITLAALLKHFRKSGQPYPKTISNLLVESCDMVKTRNPIVGMHLCFLADNAGFYNQTLLKEVSETVGANSRQVRIKEIAKVGHSLAFFGYDHAKDFFTTLLAEFEREERKDEINNYPSCLVTGLVALAYQNIYPSKLINYVFDPRFSHLLKKEGNHTHWRDLSFLDCSLEIECASYNGNRMNKNLRNNTLVNYMLRIPEKSFRNLSFNERQTIDIAQNFDKILNVKDGCMITHILPHYSNPDILLVKENGFFVPIPEEARNCSLTDWIKPNNRATWIAVVLIGRQVYDKDNRAIFGQPKTKTRQLEKLGFKVLPIILYDYVNYNRLTSMKFLDMKLRTL